MRTIVFILPLFLVVSEALSQNKDIEKKLKGFDQFVERVMKDWKVQGMAVAIVYKDKVILSKGYGYRNVDQKLPVTDETLFAIGSCTKAFTAAGVCLLEEDGKLDLDKPVREYMPDFKLQDDYVSENMTPRDLLCHRSGLPRHDAIWYGSQATRRELFERLRYLEPSKPFRAAYQYQNLMFMTAGILIEDISNSTWEKFTRERILEPLQMSATNFSVADLQKANDFSIGYTEQNNTVVSIPYMNIDAIGPAGSINSNVKDMSKWVRVLINGGKYNGKKVFSENTVRQLQTPTMVNTTQPLQYDENFYITYALGWTVTSYRGHVRVDHGGNIDGFSASTCFMPRDSIGVVILTNMNGTALTSIVRNNVLDRMLGMGEVDWNKRLLDERNKNKEAQAKAKKEDDASRVKDTKPSHPLDNYVGKFEHPAYGIVEVTKEGENLSINAHGLKSALQHYHYDVFRAMDERYFGGRKFSFVSNVSGEIDQIQSKIEPAVKDIIFKKKVGIDLVADVLSNYIGEYDFGGELAKVYIKGEKTLFLFVNGQPEYELVAIKQHEFKIKMLEGFTIKFEVDSSGKAAEMVSVQPNGTFRAKRKQT
jgi:CubicO group peptidase (beta-lactamase class C family)